MSDESVNKNLCLLSYINPDVAAFYNEFQNVTDTATTTTSAATVYQKLYRDGRSQMIDVHFIREDDSNSRRVRQQTADDESVCDNYVWYHTGLVITSADIYFAIHLNDTMTENGISLVSPTYIVPRAFTNTQHQTIDSSSSSGISHYHNHNDDVRSGRLEYTDKSFIDMHNNSQELIIGIYNRRAANGGVILPMYNAAQLIPLKISDYVNYVTLPNTIFVDNTAAAAAAAAQQSPSPLMQQQQRSPIPPPQLQQQQQQQRYIISSNEFVQF